MFCQVDSPIALAFLRRYPIPVDARGLGEQRLAAFLKRQGYTGRQARARAPGPSAQWGRGPRRRSSRCSPAAQIVLGLVDALTPIVAAIRVLTAQIRQALDDHPDGRMFRSLFIAPDSVLCAATMISEIGDCRDRYPSYRALAADAGQAPVAVESGKAKRAQFRWACDQRLREAFCVLADSSRHDTTRGPRTSMTAPAPAAPATNTPPASSAAPGAKSSGDSGTTTTPTTQPATPPYNASPLPRPDHRRSTRTDLAATQRRLGAPSPQAARRAQRAALDGKPTSANGHSTRPHGVDVMKGRAGSGGPGRRAPSGRQEVGPPPRTASFETVRMMAARPDNSRRRYRP